MTARKNNWGSDVVYFDQRLGAAHVFINKKLKMQEICNKILQKTRFFKLAPKHWGQLF